MGKGFDFLGYYEITFPAEFRVAAMNAALKHGIQFFPEERGDDMILRASPSRVKKICSAFDAENIPYRKSRVKGMLGYLISERHRYGLFAALPVAVLVTLFCRGVVWDVRVSGNSTIPDFVIEEQLENAGLYSGASWKEFDGDRVRTEVLSVYGDLSWLTVNRVGGVAYVEVIEKDKGDGNGGEDTKGYSNIVASEGGVIEEVTVGVGEQVVAVGESVKKGDVLISGIMSPDKGGGMVHSEGSVLARVGRTAEVFVPLVRNVKEYAGEKLCSVTLDFFGMKINIFKSSGNIPQECDIIKEDDKLTFFGIARLPISIERTYYREYSDTEKVISEAEAAQTASELLNIEILKASAGCDVLSRSTSGEFTGDGYRMKCELLLLKDIAEESVFEVG